MNELIAEARVLPLHAQASAHDRGTTDLPEWVTGSESAVHSERAVAVATRPDPAGDVLVRVLLGDDAEAGTRVLDGRITISTGLEVGSIVASAVKAIHSLGRILGDEARDALQALLHHEDHGLRPRVRRVLDRRTDTGGVDS